MLRCIRCGRILEVEIFTADKGYRDIEKVERSWKARVDVMLACAFFVLIQHHGMISKKYDMMLSVRRLW